VGKYRNLSAEKRDLHPQRQSGVVMRRSDWQEIAENEIKVPWREAGCAIFDGIWGKKESLSGSAGIKEN